MNLLSLSALMLSHQSGIYAESLVRSTSQSLVRSTSHLNNTRNGTRPMFKQNKRAQAKRLSRKK